MNYSEIIKKVSQETGIPVRVVNLAYKSYWKFIKQKIQTLPLKGNISEEEFNALRTNFNIPNLGKLYLTWDRVQGCKKRSDIIKKIKNEKGIHKPANEWQNRIGDNVRKE